MKTQIAIKTKGIPNVTLLILLLAKPNLGNILEKDKTEKMEFLKNVS